MIKSRKLKILTALIAVLVVTASGIAAFALSRGTGVIKEGPVFQEKTERLPQLVSPPPSGTEFINVESGITASNPAIETDANTGEKYARVESAAQFKGMMAVINGSAGYSGVRFVLGSSFRVLTPEFNANTLAAANTIDGAGHWVVSDFVISTEYSESENIISRGYNASVPRGGFFGVSEGKIKNLSYHLPSSAKIALGISSSSYMMIPGIDSVSTEVPASILGGFVGQVKGREARVENCSFLIEGTVETAEVDNGTTSTFTYVFNGGVFGEVRGVISNSDSDTAAAKALGTVTNCNTEVTGEILVSGSSSSNVANNPSARIGGLAGRAAYAGFDGNSVSVNAVIRAAVSTSDNKGVSFIGGLFGKTAAVGIRNTNAELKTRVTVKNRGMYAGGAIGRSFGTSASKSTDITNGVFSVSMSLNYNLAYSTNEEINAIGGFIAETNSLNLLQSDVTVESLVLTDQTAGESKLFDYSGYGGVIGALNQGYTATLTGSTFTMKNNALSAFSSLTAGKLGNIIGNKRGTLILSDTWAIVPSAWDSSVKLIMAGAAYGSTSFVEDTESRRALNIIYYDKVNGGSTGIAGIARPVRNGSDNLRFDLVPYDQPVYDSLRLGADEESINENFGTYVGGTGVFSIPDTSDTNISPREGYNNTSNVKVKKTPNAKYSSDVNVYHPDYYKCIDYSFEPEQGTGKRYRLLFQYRELRASGEITGFAESVSAGNVFSFTGAKLYAQADANGDRVISGNYLPQIGNSTNYWGKSGANVFDGNGVTLSFQGIADTGSYIGLFHSIAPGSVVKNFSISFTGRTGCYDNSPTMYIGTVAAKNDGTVEDVTVTFNAGAGFTVKNKAASASGIYVGGAVGSNNAGTLVNVSVYHNGLHMIDTAGTNNVYAGGLAGYSSSGDVMAGCTALFGVNEGYRYSVLADGRSKYVGGAAGYCANTLNLDSTLIYIDANKIDGATPGAAAGYSAASVSSTKSWVLAPAVNGNTVNIIGAGGGSSSINVIHLINKGLDYAVAISNRGYGSDRVNYTVEIKTVGNGVVAGWFRDAAEATPYDDDEIGIVDGSNLNPYNDLRGENREVYCVLMSSYITSYEDLQRLSSYVNTKGNSFAGAKFTLTSDITVDSASYESIGSYDNPFSGIFDGNHRTITVKNVKAMPYYGGIFGYVKAVPRINVKDGKIVPRSSVYSMSVIIEGAAIRGNEAAGFIAGRVQGAEIGQYTYIDQVSGLTVTETSRTPVSITVSCSSSVTGKDAGVAVGVSEGVSFTEEGQTYTVPASIASINVADTAGLTVTARQSRASETVTAGGIAGRMSDTQINAVYINLDNAVFGCETFAGSDQSRFVYGGAFAGLLSRDCTVSTKNTVIRAGKNLMGGTDYGERFVFTAHQQTGGTPAIKNIKNTWLLLSGSAPGLFELSENAELADFNKIAVNAVAFNGEDVSDKDISVTIDFSAHREQNVIFNVKSSEDSAFKFAGYISDKTTGASFTGVTGMSFTPAADISGQYAAVLFAKTEISSASDMDYLRSYVENVNVPIEFGLQNDIVLEDVTPLTDKAEGINVIFNGNGKTVSLNSFSQSQSNVSFFGIIGVTGTVQNVTFKLDGAYAFAETESFSAVAALNKGLIKNVTLLINGTVTAGEFAGITLTNEGTVNNTRVTLLGEISSKSIAGIALQNNYGGVIYNCGFTAAASEDTGARLSSPATAVLPKAGGIAVQNDGFIINAEVSISLGDNTAAQEENKVTFLPGTAKVRLGAVVFENNGTLGRVNVTAGQLSNVTDFAGIGVNQTLSSVMTDSYGGTALLRNSVTFKQSITLPGELAGAFISSAANVSAIDVKFAGDSSKPASASAVSVAGLVVYMNGALLSDSTVSMKFFSFDAGQYAAPVAIISGGGINAVRADIQSEVKAGYTASGFVVRHETAKLIADSVLDLKAEISSVQNQMRLFVAESVYQRIAENSFVIANNRFALSQKTLISGQEFLNGVNVLYSVGDAVPQYSISEDGVFSISVSAAQTQNRIWYSDINARVTVDPGRVASGIAGDVLTFSDKLECDGLYHVSFYDIDIDGICFGSRVPAPQGKTSVAAEYENLADLIASDIFRFVRISVEEDFETDKLIYNAKTEFNAILDGNGHTVTFNGRSGNGNAGFIGVIGRYGSVEDLTLNIGKASIGSGSAQNAGGLAGIIKGTVKNTVVNYYNDRTESNTATVTAGVSGSLGGFAGLLTDTANVDNSWLVIIKDRYSKVGRDMSYGDKINVLDIFGFENIEVTRRTDGGTVYPEDIIFTAPGTESPDPETFSPVQDWYSVFAGQNKTVLEGAVKDADKSYFYAYKSLGLSDVKYTVSFVSDELSTERQLHDLSELVQRMPLIDSTFTVVNDITVTADRFMPIGSQNKPFVGTVAGHNGDLTYKITFSENTVIDSESDADRYAGMFGKLGAGAAVENLHIVIKSSAIGDANSVAAGGLAGEIEAGVSLSSVIVEMRTRPRVASAAQFGGVAGLYKKTNDGLPYNVWLVSDDHTLNACSSDKENHFNKIYRLRDSEAEKDVANDFRVSKFGDSIIEITGGGSLFYGVVDSNGISYTGNDTVSIALKGEAGKKYELYAVFVDNEISDEGDLARLSGLINDESKKHLNIKGIEYVLTNDVAVDAAFTAIGHTAGTAFKGTLNGRGYTLTFGSGAVVTGNSAGLFGYIAQDGEVKNLIVDFSGKVEGRDNAAILSGRNDGLISNVLVKNRSDNIVVISGVKGMLSAVGGTSDNYSLAVCMTEGHASDTAAEAQRGILFVKLIGGGIDDVRADNAQQGRFVFIPADESKTLSWYGTFAVGGKLGLDYGLKSFTVSAARTESDPSVYFASFFKHDIESADDLQNLGNTVTDQYNAGGNLRDLVFYQTGDITVSSSFRAIGGTLDGLGNVIPFTAIYDGSGKKLTLSGGFDRPAMSGAAVYSGVFGLVSGTVKNLIVSIDTKVHAGNTDANGEAYAGFIGQNIGNVDNISVVIGLGASVTASAAGMAKAGALFGTSTSGRVTGAWVLVPSQKVTESWFKTGEGLTNSVNTLILLGNTEGIYSAMPEVDENGLIVFRLKTGAGEDKTTVYENYLSNYTASGQSGDLFKPASYLSKQTYQAVYVKHSLDSADDFNALYYDVRAGYKMAQETYTVAGGTVITLEASGENAFAGSIGVAGDGTKDFQGVLTGEGRIINRSGFPVFGNINTNGTVSGITVEADGVFEYFGASKWGLLVTENNGTVAGVRINLTEDAVLKGDNVAAVAGINNGYISDITGTFGGKIEAVSSAALIVVDNNNNISFSDALPLSVSTDISAKGASDAKAAGVAVANSSKGLITGVNIRFDAAKLEALSDNTATASGLVIHNAGEIRNGCLTLDSGSYISAKGALGSYAAGLIGSNSKTGGASALVLMLESSAEGFLHIRADEAVFDAKGSALINSWVIVSDYEEADKYTVFAEANLVTVGGKGGFEGFFVNSDGLTVSTAAEAGSGQTLTGWFYQGSSNVISSDETVTLPASDRAMRVTAAYIKTTLSDEADLIEFASQVNSEGWLSQSTVTLSNDITVTYGNFVPIGIDEAHAFTGKFNGNSHTVRIDAAIIGQYAGLFGFLGAGASISNLNVVVKTSIGDENTEYAGGLAAYASGAVIKGVSVGAEAHIDITASKYAGGVIGYAENSDISSLIIQFMVDTAVYGGIAAGGAAGFNGGTAADLDIRNSATLIRANNYAGGVFGINAGNAQNIFFKNRSYIEAGKKGLIAGRNAGLIKDTFAVNMIENGLTVSAESTEEYQNVYALLSYTPETPVSGENYLIAEDGNSFDKVQISLPVRNSVELLLDSGEFAVFKKGDGSGLTETNGIEGVGRGAESNKYTLVADAKNTVITFRVTAELRDEYELFWFANYVNPLTEAGSVYAGLGRIYLKEDAVFDLESFGRYSAFDLNVSINGNGAKFVSDIRLFGTLSAGVTVENIQFAFDAMTGADGLVAQYASAGSISNVVLVLGGYSVSPDYDGISAIASDGSVSAGNISGIHIVTNVTDFAADYAQNHIIIGGGRLKAVFSAGVSFEPEQLNLISPPVSDDDQGRIRWLYYFYNSDIKTADDFAAIASLIAVAGNENLEFFLKNDITVSTGLSSFTAKFNGEGNKITYTGAGTLFGLTASGEVGNLVTDGIISGDGKIKNLVFLNDYASDVSLVKENVWQIRSTEPVAADTGINCLVAEEGDYKTVFEKVESGYLLRFVQGKEDTGVLAFAGFEHKTRIGGQPERVALIDTATFVSDGEIFVFRTVSLVIENEGDWDDMVTANNAGVLAAGTVFNIGGDVSAALELGTAALTTVKGFDGIIKNDPGRIIAIKSGGVLFDGIADGTVIENLFIRFEPVSGTGDFTFSTNGSRLATLNNVWVTGTEDSSANNLILKNGVDVDVTKDAERFIFTVKDGYLKNSIINTTVTVGSGLPEYHRYTTNIKDKNALVEFGKTNTIDASNVSDFIEGARYVDGGAFTLGSDLTLPSDARLKFKGEIDARGYRINAKGIAFDEKAFTLKNALLATDSEAPFGTASATLYNSALVLEDKVLYGTGKELAVEGLIGMVFENDRFVLTAKDTADKIFVGMVAGSAFVSDTRIVLDDSNTVTKVRFVSPYVTTGQEFSELAEEYNRAALTVDAAIRAQYLVEIKADLALLTGMEGLQSFCGRVKGNGFTVSTQIRFAGLADGAFVENLVLLTEEVDVLDLGAGAVLSKVWIIGSGLNADDYAGARVVLTEDNSVLAGISAKMESEYVITFKSTVSNGSDILQLEKALAESVYIIPEKEYRYSSVISDYAPAKLSFLGKDYNKIEYYNLLLTINNRQYDTTDAVDFDMRDGTGAGFVYEDVKEAFGLTAKNVNANPAGTELNFNEDSFGRIWITTVGGTDGSTYYYVDKADYAHLRLTVSKRVIAPTFSTQVTDYNPYTYRAKDAKGTVLKNVMSISDELRFILTDASRLGLADWYDIFTDNWQLREYGTDKLFDLKTDELLDVADYYLVTDNMSLRSELLRNNFELDLSANSFMQEAAKAPAIRYALRGEISITDRIGENAVRLNALASGLEDFILLEFVSDQIFGGGDKAALDAQILAAVARNIQRNVPGFLKYHDGDGRYYVSVASIADTYRLTADFKAGAYSAVNLDVTIGEGIAEIQKGKAVYRGITNNRSVYGAPVNSVKFNVNYDGESGRFEFFLEKEAGIDAGTYQLIPRVIDTKFPAAAPVTGMFDVSFEGGTAVYRITQAPIVLKLGVTERSYGFPVASDLRDYPFGIYIGGDYKGDGLEVLNALGLDVVGGLTFGNGNNVYTPVGTYIVSGESIKLNPQRESSKNYTLTVDTSQGRMRVNKLDVKAIIYPMQTVYGDMLSSDAVPAVRYDIVDPATGQPFGNAEINKLKIFADRGLTVYEYGTSTRISDMLRPGAGRYSFEGTVINGNVNVIGTERGTLTVEKRGITVTFNNGELKKKFNQDYQIPGYAYSVTGLQYSDNGTTAGISFTWEEMVGVRAVRVQGIASPNYYLAGADEGRINIEKLKVYAVPVRIDGENYSKYSDEADPVFAYIFVDENGREVKVRAQDVTGRLGREEGNDTGTYAITQGTLSLDPNLYDFEFRPDADIVLLVAKSGAEKTGNLLMYTGIGLAAIGLAAGIAAVLAIFLIKSKRPAIQTANGAAKPKKEKATKQKEPKQSKPPRQPKPKKGDKSDTDGTAAE